MNSNQRDKVYFREDVAFSICSFERHVVEGFVQLKHLGNHVAFEHLTAFLAGVNRAVRSIPITVTSSTSEGLAIRAPEKSCNSSQN